MVTRVTQERNINIYIKGFQSPQGLNASLHKKITGWKENALDIRKQKKIPFSISMSSDLYSPQTHIPGIAPHQE